MIGWMIRTVITVALLGGVAYGLLAFELVKTEDGMRVARKKDFGFSIPYRDAGDMTWREYRREQEGGHTLAKLDWDKFKKFASDSWRDITNQLDELGNDIDLDQASDQVKEKYDRVKKEAKKRYDRLVKSWEDGDISWEQFQRKLGELNDWMGTQVDKLRTKLDL